MLRCVRKASASVCKASASVRRIRKRSQAFAEGRTCRRVHRDENRRETQNCRHFLRLALQKCQQSRGSGGRGREAQNCRHFWTRLGSSRLKSVNSHRDPGGSWSRNPELSSLLDSSRVSASQKSQQSQGSGGVVVAGGPPPAFQLYFDSMETRAGCSDLTLEQFMFKVSSPH